MTAGREMGHPLENDTDIAIRLENLVHRYGPGQYALNDVSLDLPSGKFITLLGPSGSGKSTILHIVAGLLQPSSGRVVLGSKDITHVAPQKRGVGLVFQTYALFPHLTVAQNVAYGLRFQKLSRTETRRRVNDVIDLIQLNGFEDRYPGQLSGGQQQRVAVGRAVAPSPRVLLLDEPLGALDRRLRQQLGQELRRVQRETGITTVYVTHDQEEAFAMSDQIVVMKDGGVRQSGTPGEIYGRPRDPFVAKFVGDINLLPGKLVGRTIGGFVIESDEGLLFPSSSGIEHYDGVGVVTGAIRPEDVHVWDSDHADSLPGVESIGTAEIRDVLFRGNCALVTVQAHGISLVAEVRGSSMDLAVGSPVSFGWRPESLQVLEAS